MPKGGILKLENAVIEVDSTLASTIEGARPGRYVVVRVADSGTGIAPDIIDRIFEPFFTTKGPEKGTGMGLSTVLGIIRSHQGFIRVESRLGEGSSFAVYLPLAEGKEIEAEAVEQPKTFRGKGELILVVDDDAAVRNSVEILLQHLNFRVLACGSGHEALVSFAQRRAEIDTVICDLQMPYMDGVVLVQALRRMSSQVRIIIMSGNAGERHLAEFESLGVACVLTKPFAATQLADALERSHATTPR
jgi:CheY-like chemotaxis protein